MPIVSDRDLYLLLVIAVMMLVTPWRSETLSKFAGETIASIAYRLSRGKRLRCAQGVERVFRDELTPAEKEAAIEGSFRQFWREPFVPPQSRGRARGAVTGLSHVHEALAAGRGVILWESSQFGARTMSKRILRDAGLRICQVHASNHLGGFGNHGRPQSRVRQKVIERFFDRHELRFVDDIVTLSLDENIAGRKVLFRRLQENRVVCMANDGRYGQKFVSVPFFGRARPVATGIMTLSRATGAPLLPMFCVEEPADEWRAIIEPPLSTSHAGDRDRATYDVAAQYVALLESYMRRYPTQYRTWELMRPMKGDAPAIGEYGRQAAV
jgi:lauroyl/myristoyl acyltransferase